MRKALLAAAGCLLVGVGGLVVSLPKAGQEMVGLYNRAVTEGTQQEYQVKELSAGITQLELICQQSGMQFVAVRNSSDGIIRLHYLQDPLTEYAVEVTTEGDTAQIIITKQDKQPLLSREMLMQLIYEGMSSQSSLILEVPETVSLVSDEGDGVYLGVDGGVKFANVELIRNYGYLPSENESWRQKYEEAQSEIQQLTWQLEDLQSENDRLQEELMLQPEVTVISPTDNGEVTIEEKENISPSDILQMEMEFSDLRQMFKNWKINMNDYTQSIQTLNEGTTEVRVQQVIQGDRPELEDPIRQLGALINEYNQMDAQVLDAERDYNEGFIDQEQYNSIVQSYEDSMRSLNNEIALDKGALAQQGYYWDSAVLVPNS